MKDKLVGILWSVTLLLVMPIVGIWCIYYWFKHRNDWKLLIEDLAEIVSYVGEGDESGRCYYSAMLQSAPEAPITVKTIEYDNERKPGDIVTVVYPKSAPDAIEIGTINAAKQELRGCVPAGLLFILISALMWWSLLNSGGKIW